MGGGSESGNFSLLYVLKMSLRRGRDGSKKAKTPLRNIKMVPNLTFYLVGRLTLLTKVHSSYGPLTYFSDIFISGN